MDSYERAAAAWKGIELDRGAFLAHLARHAPGEAEPQIRLDELFLALACAQGNGEALRVLEARYFPRVERTLISGGASEAEASEVLGTLREHLLVGRGGQPPRISEYSGRGSLQGWLQVTATRMHLRSRKQERREAQGDELLGSEGGAQDPELAHMRAQYGAEFKAAFQDALAVISVRERNLLRQRFIDGLGVEELARLYGVHRATATRWLNDARESLLSATRDALTGRIGLPRHAFESVLRMIGSQLHLSIPSFLREGDSSRPE